MQPQCNLIHFILVRVPILGLTLLLVGVKAHSQIAFTSKRDGNLEIYVMDVNGRNPRNVTRRSADDWTPSWSPDGNRIAFMSDRDWNNDIYVMDGQPMVEILAT